MPWKTVLMDMSNIATLNESHVQPRLRLMRRDVAEAVPETVGEAVGMTVGAMVGATVDTMVGAGGLVIGDGFMSGLGGYLDSGIGGRVIGDGLGGLVIGDGFMSGLGGYLDSGIGGGEHGTATGTRPVSHCIAAQGSSGMVERN